MLETGVDSSDDLFDTISGLDKGIFDTMLKLKGLLYPTKESTSLPSEASPTTHGVRLPKLDVPTFDGDILNWITFLGAVCSSCS